jgi:hypothetical protein
MKRLVLGLVLTLTSLPAAHAADAPAAPAGPTVTITIADSTAAQMMAQAYQANIGRKKETPEGYEKIEKDGDRIIRESYLNGPKTGAATALLGGRITVEVKTTGLPASDLRAWLDRVDQKRLARLQPDAESGVAPHGELSKALPEAPDGWMGERPNEVTTSAAGFTLSQADRTYKKK